MRPAAFVVLALAGSLALGCGSSSSSEKSAASNAPAAPSAPPKVGGSNYFTLYCASDGIHKVTMDAGETIHTNHPGTPAGLMAFFYSQFKGTPTQIISGGPGPDGKGYSIVVATKIDTASTP